MVMNPCCENWVKYFIRSLTAVLVLKMAIPRMQATLCRCCWLLVTEDSESSDRSLHRLSQYNVSSTNMQRCNSTVYRMHSCPTTASNGNTQVQELLQRKSTRSHHHPRRRRDDYRTDLWTTHVHASHLIYLHANFTLFYTSAQTYIWHL
jgi:hypothetical protein